MAKGVGLDLCLFIGAVPGGPSVKKYKPRKHRSSEHMLVISY